MMHKIKKNNGDQSVRPNNANTFDFQKEHWHQALADYDWASDEIFGTSTWGNPEDAQDRWGNYLNVKKRLMRFAKPDLVLLEIGSLAGKWTQHLLEAKEIICVDINELGFDYIKQKLPITNVSFYLSEGDELRGVDDESVDVVFSMDTFVRVSKKCIESYFKESARVCKSGGRIFFHLGSVDNDVCIRKNFILFSDEEIDDLCDSNGFSSLEVDRETLIHGVILEAVKGGD